MYLFAIIKIDCECFALLITVDNVTLIFCLILTKKLCKIYISVYLSIFNLLCGDMGKYLQYSLRPYR